MKATKLIEQLQDQVSKHGDCDVYYEYDGGVRVECVSLEYLKKVSENKYVRDWGTLKRVFIINYYND